MKSSYSLGFTTQPLEISGVSLTVKGEIPAWISGTLIRNGPAQFEVGAEPYRHWFDGLAMLHGFTFREGQVSYSARFLRSGAFQDASRAGRIIRPEFATQPRQSLLAWLWSLLAPKPTDNACVNVSVIGGAHVAMTESVHRIQYRPDTLETLGPFRYSDKLRGQLTTAHPHYDFQRRELVNFVTQLARKSAYHVYRVQDGQRRRDLLASVPVDEPGYMHSFGVTENHVVLAEFPLVVRPADLVFARKPFIESFRWEPRRATRFLVIDRNGKGIRTVGETDPMFAFHHINAYEDRGEIILDMAAYEDGSIIDALYLDRIRDEANEVPPSKLSRYRISLSGGPVTREPAMDLLVELPRINYRACNTRRYQFIFGVSRQGSGNGFYSTLVKADLKTGQSSAWSEEGCFAGEPVFVASPDATTEDAGVVLSVVLDAREEKSFLLVLDGHSFAELARTQVPQHIPFGFHGQFYTGLLG